MLRLVGLLILVVSLLGCQSQRIKKNYGHSSNIDRTIGIKQRPYATDKNIANLENELNSKGVTILSVGQDYRIIIPADLVFYYESPRLRWRSFGLINTTIDYIKQFRIVSMRVDAYSQDNDIKRAGALSLARARSMVDYLWSQAIDVRFIHTQSHTMERSPTACCTSKQGRSDVPTRIEITFRNTIV